jgi:hypothetical protein
MPNYRRVTKGLDRNAVIDLNDAWHHARKIASESDARQFIRSHQAPEGAATGLSLVAGANPSAELL